MNRQVAVALAVGVAFGLAAVSGVVAFDTGNPLGDADRQANGTVTGDDGQSVDGTRLATENGTVTLRAAPDQTVSGRTDLAAGTTLSVRVQSESPSTPFLRTAETTVTEDGTFAVTVNLSQVTDQPTFSVSVRHTDETVATTTGQVVGEATSPLSESDPDESDREPVDTEGSNDAQSRANTSFVVDGEQLTLESAPAARLQGETDLAAGTTVSVRLRSSSQDHPFLRSQETTVAENGTFAVTFDLSTIESGTTFEASARADGEDLVTRTGTVTECTSDCNQQSAASDSNGESDDGDESRNLRSVDDSDWPTGESWYAMDVVDVRKGNAVVLPLNVPDDADAVTVVVGGEDVNYEISATVRDANGDGRIALKFDTARAGDDASTLSVGDGDEINRGDESSLSQAPDPAAYPVAVYRGTSTDGERVDTGTLSILACSEGCPTDDSNSDGQSETDDWPSDEPWLAENVVHAYTGRTALIPLNIDTGTMRPSAATVVLGSDDANYRLNATVRDASGDGRVALSFNTSNAGQDAPTLSVDEGDELTVNSETSLSSSLDPANYDISVYAGTGTDDNPVDVGTLVITQAPEDS